ncbi:unnamed protein product (macronuclear) [Paramecium tetraurelia]|uniref:CRC domain-containing protein n=1 Tax=Paramecium tetraurelia TaxID=5888 RepID=A0E1D4_PARTE|nr:uncharacterized protein GSPATT00022270001 [Paramecium tetraurelia]CAK89101.1 unnamed protein product [Paramecium tetraurelia]|eukprot:XP_001456498.1 hypothetical protein (macronuclear) [Paramecium tetraurelia strain d4-2]
MDQESNFYFRLESDIQIQSGIPTFQQIGQINFMQSELQIPPQIQQANLIQSPENSMIMQASPINGHLFGNNSPIHSQQDEEDISLVNQMYESQVFSQPILDISQISQIQLQPKTKLDLTDQPKYKKKKVGCSCTKRKCSSKYCFCAKVGQSCSNLCKCVDCSNNKSFMSQQIQVTNAQEQKGCKCKKNFCLKGYCDCFAKGMQCSSNCKCISCKNMLTIEPIKDKVPIIKKKIKKFSKFYKNKKGFIRTNKKGLILTQVENQ